MNRIGIFKETLQIVNDGKYVINGKNVALKHSVSELEQAIFFPEKNVKVIIGEQMRLRHGLPVDEIPVKVTNKDTFSAALDMSRYSSLGEIAVLNFANPVNPGGGVKYGAMAQEEDLCRKSTLYVSLKSESVSEFYQFHKKECDCFSSHSIIVSPNVEVFRSYNNDLLPYTFSVAVISCAAPIFDGTKKKSYSYDEYTSLLYERIMSILSICEKMGYTKLVLGAWGCGSFSNDPKLMAKLFYKALCKFNGAFKEIEFAVFGGAINFDSFHEVMILQKNDD